MSDANMTKNKSMNNTRSTFFMLGFRGMATYGPWQFHGMANAIY